MATKSLLFSGRSGGRIYIYIPVLTYSKGREFIWMHFPRLSVFKRKWATQKFLHPSLWKFEVVDLTFLLYKPRKPQQIRRQLATKTLQIGSQTPQWLHMTAMSLLHRHPWKQNPKAPRAVKLAVALGRALTTAQNKTQTHLNMQLVPIRSTW